MHRSGDARGTAWLYSSYQVLSTVEFAYHDAFSPAPAELSFTCIGIRLYCHFAYSDTFCRSRQIILFVYNDLEVFFTVRNSGVGDGGTKTPPKVGFVENPGKNGAQLLHKNIFCGHSKKWCSWSLWEKICRQTSHKNFSGKFDKIRAKILRTTRNLLAPTPLVWSVSWAMWSYHANLLLVCLWSMAIAPPLDQPMLLTMF